MAAHRRQAVSSEGTQGFPCQCCRWRVHGSGGPWKAESSALLPLSPLQGAPSLAAFQRPAAPASCALARCPGATPGPPRRAERRPGPCCGPAPLERLPPTPGPPQAQGPAPAGGLWAGHLPGAETQPPPVAAHRIGWPTGLVPRGPQQSPQLWLGGCWPHPHLFQLHPAPRSPAPAQLADSTRFASGAGAPAPRPRGSQPGPALDRRPTDVRSPRQACGQSARARGSAPPERAHSGGGQQRDMPKRASEGEGSARGRAAGVRIPNTQGHVRASRREEPRWPSVAPSLRGPAS